MMLWRLFLLSRQASSELCVPSEPEVVSEDEVVLMNSPEYETKTTVVC